MRPVDLTHRYCVGRFTVSFRSPRRGGGGVEPGIFLGVNFSEQQHLGTLGYCTPIIHNFFSFIRKKISSTNGLFRQLNKDESDPSAFPYQRIERSPGFYILIIRILPRQKSQMVDAGTRTGFIKVSFARLHPSWRSVSCHFARKVRQPLGRKFDHMKGS